MQTAIPPCYQYTPKSKAEINRDYCNKKKIKRQKLLEEDVSTRELQKRMLNANKCKRYREKLKLQKQQKKLDALSLKNNSQGLIQLSQNILQQFTQYSQYTAKSKADINKDYCNNKKIELQKLLDEAGPHKKMQKMIRSANNSKQYQDRVQSKIQNTEVDATNLEASYKELQKGIQNVTNKCKQYEGKLHLQKFQSGLEKTVSQT